MECREIWLILPDLLVGMDNSYTLHTLPNGLRVAYSRSGGNVAYCGVAVNAGSRDEPDGYHGLAHFVEHTIFKGTRRRRAWHILNRMELVGGELNAYTTKEETLVYSVFPSGNMERAAELISDLIQNSVFPAKEIEKEKEVVAEEIRSYRDTPSESIYDDFEDMMFKGGELGHNILGTEECLSRIDTDVCMNYLKNIYVPSNMVLFAVGSIPDDKMFRLAERYFSSMHHSEVRKPRAGVMPSPPFSVVSNIGSHQAHTLTGAATFGMHDERKYALLLLNNILGGPGMNSTLNVAIRERRGYAYTVESSVTLFSDCGLFAIYFGSDERHVKRCLKLVDNEIDRIASGGMRDAALAAAKKQFVGQLLVGSENPESHALSLGKGILNFGKVSSVEEIAGRIRAVTADDLRAAAQMIANRSTLTFL